MVNAILIFDLDGTLFRTETITVPAVRGGFEKYGLTPPTPAEIFSYFGRPVEEYRQWLGSLCPGDLARRIEDHSLRRELELVPETGELYPGVREALDELRPKIKLMAICSNGPRNYVEAMVDGMGLSSYFDAVRFRREDDCDKSQMLHDLLVELAASGLPGVVIGDRYDDIEAAHANGLLALGAAYGYGEEAELDEADAIIGDPARLAETIRRLVPTVA
ncbi:MAG: HAD family hydrolase [Phycisphaerales bacterium]|nr:MAG: HAD family hydrolase [Phycisphaerales bacterium]